MHHEKSILRFNEIRIIDHEYRRFYYAREVQKIIKRLKV